MVLTAGLVSSAFALDTIPVLSVEAAGKMTVACHTHATNNGWKVNIAVLDEGGGLLYFRRQPGAFRGSVDIAINKAWTATQFGAPTRFVGDKVVPELAPGIQYMPRLIIFPGGLPIRVGDAHVGDIGVSGASGDQDEGCAKVGLEAAMDLLK